MLLIEGEVRVCSEELRLLRLAQLLLFRADLVPHLVVKIWKKKFHRHPQNDPEAQGIDQRGEAFAALVVRERRSVLMAQKVRHVRSCEPHPPSKMVDLVLVLWFRLPHLTLLFVLSKVNVATRQNS